MGVYYNNNGDAERVDGAAQPTAKDYGTQVSLDSATYNSAQNAYTATSDGLLILSTGNVANAKVDAIICHRDGTTWREFTATTSVAFYQMASIPIFEGMKVYYGSNNSNGYIMFFPYVYE